MAKSISASDAKKNCGGLLEDIQNLHLLPEIRTQAGIAQARLAVKVRWPRIVAAVGQQRASLKRLSREAARSRR